MILETVGCLTMGALYAYTKRESGDEGKRISRIAASCGLTKLDGKGERASIQCLRRYRHPWGTEYVYRIPLGFSFADFEAKRENFEDGLNSRQKVWEVSWAELRQAFKSDEVVAELRALIQGTKRTAKEVTLTYDGTLHVNVFNDPLTSMLTYTPEMFERCHGWQFYVGVDRGGKDIFHDFDKRPHLIVAGTTRFGKSVALKAIATTLIRNHAKTADIYLLDLKGGLAFERFRACEPVKMVATNAFQSLAALQKIGALMKAKEDELRKAEFEDVMEAGDPRRTFIIVDEAAELSSDKVSGDMKPIFQECERLLGEIARIGGGLGFRLIYATQYPTADVLPRQVKQNATAKLCFLLDTDTASRVVLNETGAEKLPHIKGRAIYRTHMKSIVQTPYMSNAFIDETIKPFKLHIGARKEEISIDYPTKPTKPRAAGSKAANAAKRSHNAPIPAFPNYSDGGDHSEGKATREGRKHTIIIEKA